MTRMIKRGSGSAYTRLIRRMRVRAIRGADAVAARQWASRKRKRKDER